MDEFLDGELWVWINGVTLIEYRDEPQTSLDEWSIEPNPFMKIPQSKMPRYGNYRYCCRCGRAYPLEFEKCPIHGIKLRSRPKNK